MKKLLTSCLLVLALAGVAGAQTIVSPAQFMSWSAYSNTAVAAGASTFVVRGSGVVVSTNGISFIPFTTSIPLAISASGGTAETVTPSAVSCGFNSAPDSCTVTATFTYAHDQGFRISSGDGGVAEAASIGGAFVIPTIATTRVPFSNGTGLTSSADLTFNDTTNILTGTTLHVQATDLQAAALLLTNGGALYGDTTTAHTFLIQGYDNDTGPGYVTFVTVTNGNSPSFALAAPAGGATVSVSTTSLAITGQACPMGQTASLVIDSAGAVTKGSCS